jgi:hypothetical protein
MLRSKDVDITILTHESLSPPYDETVVDMLTGNCKLYSKSIQTLICVDTVPSQDTTAKTFQKYAVLIDEDKYHKTLIDNTSVFIGPHAQEAHSGIMILICHGVASTLDHCALLRFSDKTGPANDRMNISACEKMGCTDVKLKDVICKSELVFLLCCHGDEIVPQYLTEAAIPGPDIVSFDEPAVQRITYHIFFEWLFNLVESELGTRYYQSYNATVKACIMQMMSIVKLFQNDDNAFWKFLKTTGMMSDAREVKKMQELRRPLFYNKYQNLKRFPGQFMAYVDGNEDEQIEYNLLKDFTSLCLVTWDGTVYVHHRPSNVKDMTFSTDPEVEVYLKQYHQLKHAPVHHTESEHIASEDSDEIIQYALSHEHISPDDSDGDTDDYLRDLGFHYSSSEDSGHAMGNSDSSSDDY